MNKRGTGKKATARSEGNYSSLDRNSSAPVLDPTYSHLEGTSDNTVGGHYAHLSGFVESESAGSEYSIAGEPTTYTSVLVQPDVPAYSVLSVDRSGEVSGDYALLDRRANQASAGEYSLMQSLSPASQPENGQYDHLNYGTSIGEYEKVDFPEIQFASDEVL